MGGGFGIDYTFPSNYQNEESQYQAYATRLVEILAGSQAQILTEPGRFLVGHAGVLIAEVQYVKKTPFKNFLILNTGMNHLMRPALYEAYHHMLPLNLTGHDKLNEYDVVGPICESTDVLASGRQMSSALKEGDRIVIFDTGAYGEVMANDYNLHQRPESLVISEGKIL